MMQLLKGHKAERHHVRMARLLEGSDDGICVLDAKTFHFEYANANAQGYLGHSMTELFEITPKELQSDADFASLKEAIKPLYFNEKYYVDIETVWKRKDGTTFPAEVRLQLWRDDRGTKLFAVFKDITRRKNTEEALRVAAAAFETQNGIIVTDAHKIIVRVNQAFSQITGYSAEEAVGQPSSFFRSGRHDQEFYQAIWATVTDDGYWQGEIWDRGKNGELFPSWHTITAVTGMDGGIAHYVGSFMDITGIKKAEQVLAERNRHLSVVLKAVPENIKLVCSEGVLVEMSPAGLTMLEAESLGQVQSQLLIDYVKPEYQADFVELHSKIFQELSRDVEFEVVGLKGGQRWLETRAVPLANEAGNVVNLLGVTRDISTRKREELKHTLLAAIVEHADDAIISTTPDGLISSWNLGAEHLYGYNEAEAIGQPISFLIPKVGREEGRQVLDNLTHGGGGCYETRHQGKNSLLVEVAITVSQINDKSGRVVGNSRIARDIKQQKKAEKIVLDARHHLEKQVEIIKEETSAINTALNVLLKRQEVEKSDAKAALSLEMGSTIMPFLKKLKGANTGRHRAFLIDILETNLQELVQSYGGNPNLSSAYQLLTSVEKQVASMVKQKLSSKIIAATLNISIETVSSHRKNIRKKFGLEGKASNLHSYLMSLTA
jgi:PAS domain S-box-containing protein